MAFEDFVQAMEFLAEVVGKPKPSDRVCSFYFRLVKYCDIGELKRAFEIFGCRGHWPTVSELCRECGISPPANRAERDMKEAEGDDSRGYPQATEGAAEREYGFFCFRSEIETHLETHANTELEKKTQALKALGWNVWSTNQFFIRRELEDERHKRTARFWVRDHFAFRFANPDPERDRRIVALMRVVAA